ncbi:EVI5-like protein isoform X3 [Balaenoptera musculus]|uniref:EVI5-like protein isoform X3 n=1 Tax=Balaenoptera musculus TaxID=9771 RepID=A0A8B8WX59_BALMU|nr:EVI5-like protein isoform X3 [Balaenoptera musculus]
MASPTLSPDSSSQEALSGPTCSPTSDSENLSPDELELLAKLEEQNRLLEADSKSMRSMNGSRRNSGSSLVSSSSASSNLSHLEEDTWILWGRIANEWEEWRRRKEKLLKELIRKGIPHHFRAIVWQLLCSATDMPVKNQYSELLKMSSPCEKLIRRDIARTYPEHEFFKGQDSLGQEVLFNVMKAYSLVDREVGYCQGSAFIVGLLLMQMPEEEAFCVFVRLMQEYRLRELFKPSMAELGLCIYQFEYMLQEQLPDLNTHFRSQSFHTSMYASSWFLTLFLTTFPLPVATRVFDIFMYEGLEIVFRVGLALLQVNQMELMQLDMEGMSQYFQRVIPHQFDSCPDKLILKAYQVKYNPKKMKRLEKEYAAMKSKEMEEQIEIKRLRTENRLLKQRIETLEKGQVTRAQEAEENYVIKRELAVVRQQCSSAAEDLQKAQSTIRQLQEQQPGPGGGRGGARPGPTAGWQEGCPPLGTAWGPTQPSARPQDNPRLTEDFVAHLETELEQSRLRETETLGALREMQDKVLDMEKLGQVPGLGPEGVDLRFPEEQLAARREQRGAAAGGAEGAQGAGGRGRGLGAGTETAAAGALGHLAGPSVPRRPLEGVPAEAGRGRAAGRADERAAARGPGSGRGPRAAAARGGARDAGPHPPQPAEPRGGGASGAAGEAAVPGGAEQGAADAAQREPPQAGGGRVQEQGGGDGRAPEGGGQHGGGGRDAAAHRRAGNPEGGGPHPGPAEPLGLVAVHPRAQGPDRGAESRGERGRGVRAPVSSAGDGPGVGASGSGRGGGPAAGLRPWVRRSTPPARGSPAPGAASEGPAALRGPAGLRWARPGAAPG